MKKVSILAKCSNDIAILPDPNKIKYEIINKNSLWYGK